MKNEYETKVLEIDVSAIQAKLQAIGAKLDWEEKTLMRRRVYDIEAHQWGNGKWFRLREVAGKTTLTYKERGGTEIGATKEVEVEIGNFEDMAAILQQLERNTTAYQENKRTTYLYEDTEICIDSRPKIPTYLEIEWPDTESVQKTLKLLELEGRDVGDMGVIEIYEKYGMDLHSYKVLTFND